MKRIIDLILIGIILPGVCFTADAVDTGVVTERQMIEISVSEKGLLVEEEILFNNSGDEKVTELRFWIQQDAGAIEVVDVASGESLTPIIRGNVHECNLSKHNLTLDKGSSLEVRVTYTIPMSAEHFEKTLLYDTVFLSVTFDEEELYQGRNLLSDSNLYLKLRLYRPTEAPLSITYLVAIFVGVVIVFTLMILRKRRTRIKSSMVESKEMLDTKKALLLSVLRDIEKKHRSKKISDDTYNKLKEEYKREAVSVMKKIEDLK
jgi:hypothetical protein